MLVFSKHQLGANRESCLSGLDSPVAARRGKPPESKDLGGFLWSLQQADTMHSQGGKYITLADPADFQMIYTSTFSRTISEEDDAYRPVLCADALNADADLYADTQEPVLF